MEVRPGYKQTEAGVIPEDWEVRACKEVCEKIQDGTHFSPTIRGNDYLYVTSKNVRFGFFDVSNADRIDAVQHEAIYKRCDVRRGDILLTKDGANTGNAALNDLDEALSLLSSVAFLRLDPQRQDASYFLQQILSTPGQQQIKEAMSGNAITRLTLAKINKLRFPVAPLPEQRAIAAALSDVDALLAKLDQFIVKKRDLKQAAMQQLLTGQTRLPGFSGEWEVKRLGDIGNCLRGVTYKGDSDLSLYDTAHTKRLLRSNNVQNSTVVTTEIQFVNAARVSENQLLRENDILICMANGSKALVGKAGLFTVSDGYKYTFGAFMGCFRSNSVESNSTFVFFLFQTGRYRNYINNLLAGSSINNLNPSSIESLEFPIPLLPEQTAIATVLSDMDTELAALETRRDKTRNLKQGMMQVLLTGKIRLIN